MYRAEIHEKNVPELNPVSNLLIESKSFLNTFIKIQLGLVFDFIFQLFLLLINHLVYKMFISREPESMSSNCLFCLIISPKDTQVTCRRLRQPAKIPFERLKENRVSYLLILFNYKKGFQVWLFINMNNN